MAAFYLLADETVQNQQQLHLATGTVQVLQRKDGRVIDSIMATKRMRRADGSVDYSVGLVMDTTERKRAEEKFAESERRFRQLAESIPHHAWSFRGDDSVGDWNQRLIGYTGLTEEELCS